MLSATVDGSRCQKIAKNGYRDSIVQDGLAVETEHSCLG